MLGPDLLVGVDRSTRACRERRFGLWLVRPRQQDRAAAIGEELACDCRALGGALAWRVDRLRHALARAAVVVDLCKAEVGEGPARELPVGLIGGHPPAFEVLYQLVQLFGIHQAYYPASMNKAPGSLRRIAYLGPRGTFSEEALLSQVDLADLDHVATTTIPDAIALVAAGEVDAAFVPFENSIEGSVNLTLDQLVFDVELLIQREVVLEVHMDLLARPGVTLGSIERILSFPFATAQVRGFLADRLAGVPIEATNSTAEGARLLGDGAFDGTYAAAVAPPLTAAIYGLEVLAHAIEDHQGNQTRFLLVTRDGVPDPTGRDRTTIACFQRRDRPGSLYEILGAFATRSINLTRIESRPTRQGLGDYCFVIEFEGHVNDEGVGAALSDLDGSGVNVKFLGSYPVHGEMPVP
jgi:prephenate dehydratase